MSLPLHEHAPPKPFTSKIRGNASGPEQRIEVNPLDAVPYRWICRLTPMIVTAGGILPGQGTGFLINIPNSTQCVILTAAHNLYNHASPMPGSPPAKYVDAVVIDIPGRARIDVDHTCLRVPDAYRTSVSSVDRLAYDYGIIVLPGTKPAGADCGFGFAATMTDREILECDLNMFGYPAQKMTPETTIADTRTLYGAGGRVQSVSNTRLRYLLHTSEGQSGGPVYIWSKGFWTVIGIHGFFENMAEYTINSAARLRVSMLQDIISWLTYPLAHACIRSNNLLLSIPTVAPQEPSEHAPIAVITPPPPPSTATSPTTVSFIPVKSYSEGNHMRFSDNLWVIASLARADSYLSFDEKRIPLGVGASSRLSATPILRRSPEIVRLVKTDSGVAVAPVRFPAAVALFAKGRGFDFADVLIVGPGGEGVTWVE